MDGLELSLSLIARHATFLLLVLPLIGALLVVLSAPWGREIVLRTALTNIVFAIAVAVLMLVQFEPSPVADAASVGAEAGSFRHGFPRIQLASSSRLDAVAPSQSLLRIDVGVDGISLWFVTLMPLVTLAAVVHARHERQLTALLALLLLLQASLTGLFAALNVVMFAVCLELSGLLLFLLIGCWGSPEHRREAALLAVFQFAGSLMVLFGLLTAVVAHYWLTAQSADTGFNLSLVALAAELPLVVRESTPEAVAGAWGSTERLIFWTLLTGFAIKSAVFPFHRGFCSPGAAWPACAGVFAWGVFPCIGVYGFLRIVAPVCEQTLAAWAPSLALLLLLGSVYCGLLALAQSELKRMVAYASVAHAGLAFAAAVSHTAAGVSGAVFHLISHVVGFSLLAAVVAGIERRYETLEIRAFGGLASRLPWIAAAFFVAALSICGLPGLSGFPALWQTMIGLMGLGEAESPSLVDSALSLIAAGLLAWTFLSAGQRVFWGTRREPLQDFSLLIPTAPSRHDKEIRDWGPPERIASILLTAVLLAAGVAPQFVADRVPWPRLPASGRKLAASATHAATVPEVQVSSHATCREGRPL
jgi:NADH-quinone oxidoreductase subunit M